VPGLKRNKLYIEKKNASFSLKKKKPKEKMFEHKVANICRQKHQGYLQNKLKGKNR
jgi:hypothetical protein